jgi:ATP-dependent Lhr-like helicase
MENAQPTTSDRSAFSLLHPSIQRELYRMGWTSLRAIQADAIRVILEGSKHLIVSAQTAGGKTEAAFLPILSSIVDEPAGGVRALYIGPLKALINDQFRRLEELCERAEIPVHRWHGDVGQSARKAFLAAPAGVLLITPESLEAMFINRPSELATLFGRLSYVVIDELHAFIGTERGVHLKSLLCRLAAKSTAPFRFVGLSATLGDTSMARQWLVPDAPDSVEVVVDGHKGKTIRLVVKGYLRTEDGDATSEDDQEGEPSAADEKLVEDLIAAHYGDTALIFANSRARLEFYADLARRKLESQKLPNRFRVHHGSLSKAEREDTEAALRSDTPTATFCSSTLEMGIDVGNVKAVGQIGAPWSVSSLAQRLGRSGRRDGEASVLRMYIEANEPGPNTPLVDRLFPQLLQAIAMTQLALEGWAEPPDVGRVHASTLVHQIMSVIAERGGAPAMNLFSELVAKGAFRNIDTQTFAKVLRGLGAEDIVEQTPEGDLILGLKGERIVRSHHFYAAFATPEELAVVHNGRTIGTVESFPGMGADGFLILAGRRWKIIEVDEDRKTILVQPSRGGRLPKFAGAGGADIHFRVRQKMREVLLEDDFPPFLDATAREMLSRARRAAIETEVDQSSWVVDGTAVWLFTWASTRVNRTLQLIGNCIGGSIVQDEGIALKFENASKESIVKIYKSIREAPPEPNWLAGRVALKTIEKYDAFLPEDVLNAVFASNALDLSGALNVVDGPIFC